MQFKEPKVIFIAEPHINYDGLEELVSELGAPDWAPDISIADSEALVEVAGRLCYKSFAAGLNANVTKVREGNRSYLANILAQAHGSVLEHASASFVFLNVSRVLTHEIVRHRAGVGISQESLRYVRLTDLGAYEPDVFDDADKAVMENFFAQSENFQKHFADKYDLDDEASFARKKKLTSAMRRLAPIGLTTNIMVTANHRAWRHMIEMRANGHAEEEIQKVMRRVAEIMLERFPNLYQDMTLTDDGVEFENSKV